eukprot:scaffold23771_cov21-Prasinocladus_malaysianus.AAC.1
MHRMSQTAKQSAVQRPFLTSYVTIRTNASGQGTDNRYQRWDIQAMQSPCIPDFLGPMEFAEINQVVIYVRMFSFRLLHLTVLACMVFMSPIDMHCDLNECPFLTRNDLNTRVLSVYRIRVAF